MNGLVCTCSMISRVVVVFDRSLHGSSSVLIWPRLHSETHRYTVGNEGADFFDELTIFVRVSVADKPYKTKNFITELYSV